MPFQYVPRLAPASRRHGTFIRLSLRVTVQKQQAVHTTGGSFIFRLQDMLFPFPLELFPFPFSISSPKLLPFPCESHGNRNSHSHAHLYSASQLHCHSVAYSIDELILAML